MTCKPMLGAKPIEDGTCFGLWALGKNSAAVEIEGFGRHQLEPIGDGYFTLDLAGVAPGARYRFSLDDGPLLPDLASRWQPDGSDGPSVVVGEQFAWTDADWQGPTNTDQVIYELHIGTFTQDGTWEAATERLQWLAELGVTIIQIMPIGSFKGKFGWGYDTTLPYAPFAPYGSPNAMRGFVDRAHELGIGVILDVVYNHVGAGEHFSSYSEYYFSKNHTSEWGPSFNFDGEASEPVRDFVIGNVTYWIGAFHLDGLRIDAAQELVDKSSEHILSAIVQAARKAGGKRNTYVIVENQPQERQMIEPVDGGGYGLDAMYNDDFQHAVRVAATGRNDFYYRDYLGTPQEIVSSLKYGFLYHGQRSAMRDKPYGTYNFDTPPQHFVHFLENHDQVANSAKGFRLTTLMCQARLRAITSLLLLGPQTPCLFQGQEFGSSKPFMYFLGLDGEEGKIVAEGRKSTLTQFPSVADPEMQSRLASPSDPATFASSKLNWDEAEAHGGLVRLHRDLLQLRRTDASFSQSTSRRVDGAVLGEAALLLRYITPDAAGHRVLLLNLGRDLQFGVIAEPLLAPAPGQRWHLAWSSEHPKYDGAGRVAFDPDSDWVLPSDCALLLASGVK
jgi:maltooligosyltrehalose trehalohydrolase